MMGSSYLYIYWFVLTSLLPGIIFVAVNVLFSSQELVWLAGYLFQTLVSPSASLVLNRETQPGLTAPSPQARGFLLGYHEKQFSLKLYLFKNELGDIVGRYKGSSSLPLRIRKRRKRILQEIVYSVSSVLKAWALGIISTLQLFWAPTEVLFAHSCDCQRDSPRGQQEDHSSLLFEQKYLISKCNTFTITESSSQYILKQLGVAPQSMDFS